MNRYEKYKDSGVQWIGEVPSHWEVIPTHYILNETKTKYSDIPETLSLLSVSGIDGVYVKEYDNEQQIRSSDELESYNVLRQGQLVMNPLVNPLRLDYFAMCLSPYDGVVSPVYMTFETSQNTKFIEWFYKSHLVIQDLIRNTKGIRPLSLQLSRETLKEVGIIIPPLTEQHQIVSFLDEKTSLIDDLIKKKEQKIGLLKEYRTSLINRVITKGLNPDCPMKDSGVEWIGEIPSHWDTIRIKDTGFLFGGLTGKSGDDFRDEGNPSNRPFIPFTNIFRNTYISPDNFGMVVINDGENQNRVQKNDLFFLMSSEDYEDLGKTSILIHDYDELYLNSFCKGLRITNEDVYPLFLNYQLSGYTHKKLISVEGSGFTRINLRQDKLTNTPVLLPPLTEQHQIVSVLDEKTGEIDRTIQSEVNKIELLKEYRQSLISSVITGKIKVVN